MTDTPLVSILVPTQDRRAFFPQLLSYIARQTWPADRLQIVVVDDGRDKVADLIPDDPRFVYEALPQRVPLGTKRNRLAELATGSILIHFDDDDVHQPDRIARSVALLEASGADVVGTSSITFWDLATGGIHQYPAIGPKHACAGTMAYRRSYWESAPFAPDPHTEERQFLKNFAAKLTQFDIPPHELLVCIAHSGNLLPKNTQLPMLNLSPADVVPDAADRAFYDQLDLDDW